MPLDPAIGVVIGLVAVLATGFLGLWVGGVFHRSKNDPHRTAAE